MKTKLSISPKPKNDFELPTEKRITAKGARDQIMLFYGPPGVGKTTFVNELADRVFFFSTDRGTRDMKALARECSNWEDMLATLKKMESPNAPKYDIVAIDHVDDWANFAEDYVCKQMGIDSLGDAGYAKGWRAFKKELFLFLGRLRALKMGIVFIAHETIKTVKTRAIETDRTMPDMGKSAWKVIVPLVSIVGFCGFQRIKQKNGDVVEKRVLITDPTEAIYAKDRTRRTKKSLEYLNGAAFMQSFQTPKKEAE